MEQEGHARQGPGREEKVDVDRSFGFVVRVCCHGQPCIMSVGKNHRGQLHRRASSTLYVASSHMTAAEKWNATSLSITLPEIASDHMSMNDIVLKMVRIRSNVAAVWMPRNESRPFMSNAAKKKKQISAIMPAKGREAATIWFWAPLE